MQDTQAHQHFRDLDCFDAYVLKGAAVIYDDRQFSRHNNIDREDDGRSASKPSIFCVIIPFYSTIGVGPFGAITLIRNIFPSRTHGHTKQNNAYYESYQN